MEKKLMKSTVSMAVGAAMLGLAGGAVAAEQLSGAQMDGVTAGFAYAGNFVNITGSGAAYTSGYLSTYDGSSSQSAFGAVTVYGYPSGDMAINAGAYASAGD